MNRNPQTSLGLNYGEQSMKNRDFVFTLQINSGSVHKRCNGTLWFLFGAQTNGSPCSPGNDLSGLNDDGVSSAEKGKEYKSPEHGSESGCL